ncbi:hypothetical protein, partial [Bacteroides sp.]|uniref:hypothetical protein n=1 Tax=Bacteroides sp. TaxID=29523 RepID=UPI002FCB7393
MISILMEHKVRTLNSQEYVLFKITDYQQYKSKYTVFNITTPYFIRKEYSIQYHYTSFIHSRSNFSTFQCPEKCYVPP